MKECKVPQPRPSKKTVTFENIVPFFPTFPTTVSSPALQGLPSSAPQDKEAGLALGNTSANVLDVVSEVPPSHDDVKDGGEEGKVKTDLVTSCEIDDILIPIISTVSDEMAAAKKSAGEGGGSRGEEKEDGDVIESTVISATIDAGAVDLSTADTSTAEETDNALLVLSELAHTMGEFPCEKFETEVGAIGSGGERSHDLNEDDRGNENVAANIIVKEEDTLSSLETEGILSEASCQKDDILSECAPAAELVSQIMTFATNISSKSTDTLLLASNPPPPSPPPRETLDPPPVPPRLTSSTLFPLLLCPNPPPLPPKVPITHKKRGHLFRRKIQKVSPKEENVDLAELVAKILSISLQVAEVVSELQRESGSFSRKTSISTPLAETPEGAAAAYMKAMKPLQFGEQYHIAIILVWSQVFSLLHKGQVVTLPCLLVCVCV